MMATINENCPCTGNCERHGNCEACQAHHAGGMTTCQRLAAKEAKKNASK